MILDVFCDLVVLQRRDRGVLRRIGVVEEGLRRVRQHVHVDLGRLHVLEALLQVPGAARKRLVGDAAELEHREILVDRLEAQPQRRRLLGDHLHGVFVENMGVDVDGLGHKGPPREGSLYPFRDAMSPPDEALK